MIYPILFLSFVLRLILLNQSLWLDEAINVLAVKNYGYGDLITKYSLGDFHPPLYHLILKLWTVIFGYSEISVRLPSVIFGVLTVYVVYLIGKNLSPSFKSFNSGNLGLIAALIYAVNPLAIYYSQEARMYSLAVFLSSLVIYFLLLILRRNDWKHWYLFTISAVLLLYSEYYGWLVWVAINLYLLSVRHKLNHKTKKRWFISVLTTGLFVFPWLVVLVRQFSQGLGILNQSSVWGAVVGGANLKNLLLVPLKFIFGRISFPGYYYPLIGTGVLIFYSVLVLSGLRKSKKINNLGLIMFWLVIPISISFVISFIVPIFSYFRLIVSLPAVAILTSLGVIFLPSKTKGIVSGLLIMISSVSLLIFWTNKTFQREDWRGAVNFLNTASKNNREAIVFKGNQVFSPFVYYKRIRSTPPTFVTSDKFVVSKLSINKYIDEIENKQILYIFGYLGDITDPEHLVEQNLTKTQYSLKQTYDFSGVGLIYKYGKNN